MRINAVKVKIATEQGEFGFFVPFLPGLNIVRGANSSGKSTLILSLLYGLGAEELAGGKNESVLPYALKDYFYFENKKIDVIASEVYVEVENIDGKIVTFRRAIKGGSKSPKLIEVLSGAFLTQNIENFETKSTYIHDAGAAQKDEGFHAYLEKFLGYVLPMVPSTNGGETKLYIQAIFASLAVEQKRGWTDYIANIPYFGIRDARTRVVEFLLNLDVFETNSTRGRLDAESVFIANSWSSLMQDLKRISDEVGVVIDGLPLKPDVLFVKENIHIAKLDGAEKLTPQKYTTKLRDRYEVLRVKALKSNGFNSADKQDDLKEGSDELVRLVTLYETALTSLSIKKAALSEYRQLYDDTLADVAKNKTARKLRNLGAEAFGFSVAENQCPTCHQSVPDSLLEGSGQMLQMDLDTNIGYLEKQERMLDRQISGVLKDSREAEAYVTHLNQKVGEARAKLNALRTDITSGNNESKAIIREQIVIENESLEFSKFEQNLEVLLEKFINLALQLKENQAKRKKLPKSYYSEEDERKIRVFEKNFRANASAFGYESADISAIQINDDALLPFLSNIELREIVVKNQAKSINVDANLKNNSSASDFVRLIWSYLIALYQAASLPMGGSVHPKLLIFDEPGQHSMGETSQRALLLQLSGANGLQSIVAASFDESDAVFKEVTRDVKFNFIDIEGRTIKPL